MTVLEQVLPHPDFASRHTRWVDAPPERVWHALTTMSLAQLRITRPLVALRHLDHARESRPLFEHGPLTMLQTQPPSYALGGAIARPWQFRPERHELSSPHELATFMEPGWAVYATEFVLEPRDGGVQLTTRTRGRCTDAASRRRFGAYWALIRMPSGLVRRDLLATAARVAQA